MKLEKIIDILGDVLKERFIVRRESLINPTFKLYCTYTIELYKYIDNDFKLYHQYTTNYKMNEPKGLEEIELLFLKEVLEKSYGNKDEQISNTSDRGTTIVPTRGSSRVVG